MNPLHTWLAFMVGSTVYHGVKVALGFTVNWGDLASAGFWVGLTLLWVHFGWVRA